MFNQVNINLFNAINQFAGTNILLDNFGIILANYLPVVFILFLIYLWFSKGNSKDVSLFAGYSAVLGLLLNFLITLFYFHPRPFMNHIGTAIISHIPDASFPSDHTTFMLSIAFTLLYFKKTRKAGIILSTFGVIGGIARIYCGVHYPFDILGSIIVAIVSAYIIFSIRERLQKLNLSLIKYIHKLV